MRTLFYVAFGATVGVIVVRRASDFAARWTPEGMAIQAGGVKEQVAVWWEQVQQAAAEREVELREGLGIASSDEDAA